MVCLVRGHLQIVHHSASRRLPVLYHLNNDSAADKEHSATRAGVGHCWDVCRSAWPCQLTPKCPLFMPRSCKLSRGMPTPGECQQIAKC